MLEEKLECVVVGEALVVDIEIDFMKLGKVIAKVRCEVIVLKDETKAIQIQQENMKKMSGSSFWPKPIIHPSGQGDNDNQCIQL